MKHNIVSPFQGTGDIIFKNEKMKALKAAFLYMNEQIPDNINDIESPLINEILMHITAYQKMCCLATEQAHQSDANKMIYKLHQCLLIEINKLK